VSQEILVATAKSKGHFGEWTGRESKDEIDAETAVLSFSWRGCWSQKRPHRDLSRRFVSI